MKWMFVVLLVSFASLAAAQPRPYASRLDPRLSTALAADAAPVAVWVEFADKGERGPGDLAARLAAAEEALTPEARRRRVRAGMNPIVDYLDVPLCGDYVAALVARGLQPYGQSRWFNGCAVHVSGAALQQLATLPFVSHLSPVPLAAPRAPHPVPADEWSSLTRPMGEARVTGTEIADGQTATQLARLGVTAVHDSGYIGTGVMVCLLDEGFNYYNKHEATRLLPVGNRTRDFVDGDLDVTDTLVAPFLYQHGQWTLSTLGGFKPGVYIGPGYGATFALGRTENSASEKPIEMVNWAMGAEWADSLGADVISSSLGYNLFPDSAGTDITYPMLDGHTTIITRAAEIAASRGILVVNSAGNDGNNAQVGRKISAPSDANGDSVLCIGAVDSLGTRAGFSSKGPSYDGRIKPDLAAQGVAVLMASAGGSPNAYVRNNGTSFSCPLTAGLAACLIQARPTWPATLIIRALRETASQATHPDTLKGYGIPNGLAALRWRPDTVGVPGGGTSLAFALSGANPLRTDGWPLGLRLSVPGNGPARHGRVRVYDVRGRVLATAWSGDLSPGQVATPAWDGRDGRGERLAPGLYFLAFEAGADRIARRLVVLR